MSEWTPGPWLTPEEAGDPYKVMVVDHEGCDVWPWRDRYASSQSDEAKANMRLAYKAPEMASMLREAYAELAHLCGSGYGSDNLEQVTERVRALLKRIGGET